MRAQPLAELFSLAAWRRPLLTQLATSHLDANLYALSRSSPDAVARIRASIARPDMQFIETDDGVPTAQIGEGREARLLASKRRPLDEAVRLIAPIDVKDAAVYVVAGFGMGYHVAELARKLGRTGLIIVYEPDAALLRGVLERLDHSAWMLAGNVCIMTDPEDSAAMGETLRGLEGLVGLGVTLVQHPPSGPRLGDGIKRFHERFTGVVDAVKMTVITTLVHVRITMRNLLQNADIYATRGGIAELAGACAGRPAIVVSAGPSLQRNLALVDDPAVRERCVIIAVQTVLKTLLARGIRPHFVTALDYSEINRRFYEGLTAEQVEGITLVVEPKVNPSVLMAWPGKVLCTGDATIDLLLGEKLARPHGSIRQGATVAHLAYYLARHLGCDPVGLVGQDLGFTDGQYYAAGAAIHAIWAAEVNEFKSLELMEWQRIVRMGPHLRRVRDTLGREMFTDSQMHSYLAQFETDFRDDAGKGLRTIDATEGGVSKQHTTTMTLRAFLESHARADDVRAPVSELIATAAGRAAEMTPSQQASALRDLRRRIVEVRGQVSRVAALSARTALALAEMQEHRDDVQRVNRLIEKVHASAKEVEQLKPGFNLTQLLGQGTVFNRVRADRMIHLDEAIDAAGRQGLQIQRDIENVRGLERAATQLVEMLEGALVVLDGGERVTRDMPKNEQELEREARAARDGQPVMAAATRTSVVSAIVPIDLRRGGLGWNRSLAGTFTGRVSVLAATVDRLLACKELREIVLVSDAPGAVRELLEPRQCEGGRVRIEPCGTQADERRRRAIAAGRLWARNCWRGGLGDLTVFDEVFEPRSCAAMMTRLGADAALVVGPDWCVVDPALCDEIIRRHRENPDANRLTFSQAVPGLCGCVVSRELALELSKGADAAKIVFASLGGVLGYVPMAPLQDLIAHPICLALAGPVRDCGLRLIADTERMRQMLDATGPADSAAMVVECVTRAGLPIQHACEELVVGRNGLDIAEAVRACGAGSHVAVTLGNGGWDPMDSDAVWPAIDASRAAGAAGVHVRTRLRRTDNKTMRRLLQSGAEVISVDCFGEGRGLGDSRDVLERLLAERAAMLGDVGMGVPWIVPRLVRRDATYELVEEFVNEWVTRCGWACLDGLREPRAGERIGPLPLPTSAAARLARTRRFA
jgi:hypothetical protein